jgi:hypothetical protein
MKKLSIIIILVGITNFVEAQSIQGCNIQYSYDKAGNRIKRNKECLTYSPLRPVLTQQDSSKMIGLAMQVYPNPASEVITVKTSEFLLNSTIEILDISGKIVFNSSFMGNQLKINIHHLAQGTYHVNLKDSERKVNLIQAFVK